MGRLILAQDLPNISSFYSNPPYNVVQNNGPNYMVPPQQAGSIDPRNDLLNTYTLWNLSNHLFDHGHLGYYPQAIAINQQDPFTIVDGNPDKSPRGIFNVNAEIRTRIAGNIQPLITGGNFILQGFPRTQGYNIDSPVNRNDQRSSLKRAAINLIETLFSSNSFNPINIVMAQPPYQNTRFTITATYTGTPIDGLDYQQLAPGTAPTAANCLGFQNDGTPTNTIFVVVGVDRGKISIVSLYPLG